MKAVTVGSAMIDIITVVGDDDIERVTMTNATSSYLLLEQGRKIEAESISIHVGGGAVNAAVSMSRLGLEVAVLSKIGCDLNGKKVRERLKAEKVSDQYLVETDKGATGTAVMISSHDRNATILTYRGANRLLQERDIPADLFDGVQLLYVTALSDHSADCFPIILEQGKKAGAFVTANPGIRQLTSRTQPFFESLKNIDLLTVNEKEASALIPALAAQNLSRDSLPTASVAVKDAPPLMKSGLHFGGFDMGLVQFMSLIRQLGPSKVLITDGVRGAYLADDDGIHFCPVIKTQVAGTAGAGDSFASSFTALTAMGADPELALRAATINAASVVSFVDTQTGLLSYDNITARAAAFAERLPVSCWNWAKDS